MDCALQPILIVLVTLVVPRSVSNEAAWRNTLKDPAFSRFVDQLSYKAAPLDVGVPPSCFTDHDGIHEDVSDFLKRLKSSFRLFTTSRGFCQTGLFCYPPYTAVSKVLLLVCGKEWTVVCNSMLRPYSHHVTIFSDEFYFRDTGAWKYYFRKKMTEVLQQGAGYNMSFIGKHTHLTMGDQTECLSCLRRPVLGGELLNATRQVPLRGQNLRVHCLYPYICELPTFPVLVDVLRHKGANVTTFHIDKGSEHMEHLAEAFLMNSLSVIAYTPIPEIMSTVRVPMVTVPVYYDSFAYSVFARRRHPLSKEVVILLPFTWQVWASLWSTMALCVITLELLSRTPLNQAARAHVCRSSMVHTFAALLLQQSCTLPATIRHRTPVQLVVGVWALLAVVVGTAFRGSLTSLLRQIPLEGSALEFANERDLLEQDYSFCRLTYVGDEIGLDFVQLTPVRRMQRICVTGNNEVKYMNHTRALFLLHEPCVKNHEGYVRQLYQNDYAPLPQKLTPYLAGPSIRANSWYRDAVKATVSRTFEGGLFQRELSLDDHMRSYKAAQAELSETEMVIDLTVSDLKGGFSFVAFGLGLATFCLVIELGIKGLNSISSRGTAV